MPCQKMATVESWVFSWKMFKIKKRNANHDYIRWIYQEIILQELKLFNCYINEITLNGQLHTHIQSYSGLTPLFINFLEEGGGGVTNHPDKYSKIFSETKHSRKLRIICWSLLRDIIWHILSSKIIFTWNQIDNIYTYKYFIFNCFIMLMIIKVRFLKCAIHVIQIPRRHVSCLVVEKDSLPVKLVAK